jgi:hypothetical protein
MGNRCKNAMSAGQQVTPRRKGGAQGYVRENVEGLSNAAIVLSAAGFKTPSHV